MIWMCFHVSDVSAHKKWSNLKKILYVVHLFSAQEVVHSMPERIHNHLFSLRERPVVCLTLPAYAWLPLYWSESANQTPESRCDISVGVRSERPVLTMKSSVVRTLAYISVCETTSEFIYRAIETLTSIHLRHKWETHLLLEPWLQH